MYIIHLQMHYLSLKLTGKINKLNTDYIKFAKSASTCTRKSGKYKLWYKIEHIKGINYKGC